MNDASGGESETIDGLKQGGEVERVYVSDFPSFELFSQNQKKKLETNSIKWVVSENYQEKTTLEDAPT